MPHTALHRLVVEQVVRATSKRRASLNRVEVEQEVKQLGIVYVTYSSSYMFSKKSKTNQEHKVKNDKRASLAVKEEKEESRTPASDLRNVMGCKALLLEIIRRASYDWMLYRTSRKLQNKYLADTAYSWLFKEEPGSPEWLERDREGKHVTSFFCVCDLLNLDPLVVRERIRRLTPKSVIIMGRSAEGRREEVLLGTSLENSCNPRSFDYSLGDDLLFDV